MAGRGPKLVHRPELVTLDDGRYLVHCPDCLAGSDEPTPIGIGLPVSGKVSALGMLRNHLGPAARRMASPVLPALPPGATKRPANATPRLTPTSRTA